MQITRSVAEKKTLQNLLVDGRQFFQFADINIFIDLVNAFIDRTEFNDLGACGCDKAAIRGSARRR